MQTFIKYGEVGVSEALKTHVTNQVEHAMRHYQERFTRVEVHLHDDNAAKSGPNDKRCVIEARPAGFDPIVVEATGDDMYATISETAKKLTRATRHFMDRHSRH